MTEPTDPLIASVMARVHRLTDLFGSAVHQIVEGKRTLEEIDGLEAALVKFTGASLRIDPNIFPDLEHDVLTKVLADINGKGRNALRRGYPQLTLGGLLRMSEAQLNLIKDFSSASVEQLKQALSSYELRLGMSEDEMRRRLLVLRKSKG